ncbi:lipopolysaccharide biosynthesis protein [Curtobacterium sp. ZW137]|uniref:lipopolysaccharide biosynthesis protein n=1 Tax=Curtobacterium sp. ZW137 TaxID=2485104 RepID=UPI000F4B361C|nr:oligosaccharide flippase family protein [Curtobacterium sp. ZW137]ROP65142.1 O-antigen/teichoic acid export membrane protein [Curtobacterium sp. ZW137]
MRRPPRAPSAVLTILVGTVLGQGAVVAVSPVLTRTYSASDFGTLTVVTAIASVLGAGAALGTDRALAVAEPNHVRSLITVGFGATLLAGLLTAGVAWALRESLAAWFRAPALADLWWVLPVTTIAIAVQRICSAVLARRRAHRALAVRNACQGLGQTAWNLAMAFAGPIGLVGGLAAGRFAAVLGMLRPAAGLPSRRQVAQAASEHRRFLTLTPWSAMLNVVGQQAPGIVIAAVHGSAAAGFVALTMRVLGSPVGMVADAVSQYAAGAFGQRARSGSPIRPLLVRLTGRLLVAGGAGALVVLLAGPVLFGAVFGAEWQTAGSYARILVPAFAIQVAVSPVSQVLSMLGRQTTQLVWDVARLVSTTGAVLVPSVLGAPMPVVLAVLAAAMTASYGAMLVLVLLVTKGTPASP